MTRPAYLVAELSVKDAAKLAEYGRRAPSLVEKFGGEVLGVSSRSLKVVEGAWDGDVLVIQRWPSLAAFEAFYGSDEYQPLKHLRQAACDSSLVIFEAGAVE